MFTLNNFESFIDPKILARGQDYYEQGYVGRLEDFGDGEYSALVFGTSRYNVRVKLKNSDIENWECSCPYDWGLICKHVVAVIFSIRDGDFKTGKPLVNEGARAALEEISDKKLRDFVVRQLKRNWQFRQEFMIEFVEGYEPDEEEDFWEEY